MTDMPKEIWVTAGQIFTENVKGLCTKYVRADASPDPAALVEALRDLITHAEVNDWTGIAAINSAKKALALFTGKKGVV